MDNRGDFDALAFKQFEHDGWTEVAAGYHHTFGELTEQTVQPVLDAAQVGAAQDVLDLACGTGRLAAGAVTRGARVVGVDLSAAMVAQAQRLCPAGRFEVGDAEALAFGDRAFDAVVCGFGILHLPDAARGVREVHRVLRPGGRFACSIWQPADRSPFSALVQAAVAAHGRADAGVPAGPVPYQYGDPERLGSLLESAGFVGITVEVAPVLVRFAQAEQIFDALMDGGVRVRKMLEAQTPDAFARIKAAAMAAADAYRDEAGFAIPRPAVVGSGQRP